VRAFTDPHNGDTLYDKLPSDPLEYSGEDTGPTDAQWRTFFYHPEKCDVGETYFRQHLPKDQSKVVGGYRGRDVNVLYFDHSLPVGFLVTIIAAFAALLALFWSIAKHNISGGFSMGAFIIALISLMAYGFSKQGVH
jgi:hypothetical protein